MTTFLNQMYEYDFLGQDFSRSFLNKLNTDLAQDNKHLEYLFTRFSIRIDNTDSHVLIHDDLGWDEVDQLFTLDEFLIPLKIYVDTGVKPK